MQGHVIAAAAAAPNVRAAIEALEAAKAATDPLPKLDEAMKDLDKAVLNRKGKRDEAKDLVAEATELAKAGKKPEMTDKINHAIAELHSAMDAGVHHRK